MASSVQARIRPRRRGIVRARALVVVAALAVALPTAGVLVDYATGQTPTFRRSNPDPDPAPATSARARSARDDGAVEVLGSRLGRVESDVAANSQDLKAIAPAMASMQKDIEFMSRIVWGVGAMILALFGEMLWRRLTGK